jgi:hypothetical protein
MALPPVEQTMGDWLRTNYYPTTGPCFKEISIPCLPAFVLEQIIEEAWLAPQTVEERIRLMTNSILVSRVYLHVFLHVSARELFIPTFKYAEHLAEYCEGRTPLTSLFPTAARLPRLLSSRMTVCYANNKIIEGKGLTAALRLEVVHKQGPPSYLNADQKQECQAVVDHAFVNAGRMDRVKLYKFWRSMNMPLNSGQRKIYWMCHQKTKERRHLIEQSGSSLALSICCQQLYDELFESPTSPYFEVTPPTRWQDIQTSDFCRVRIGRISGLSLLPWNPLHGLKSLVFAGAALISDIAGRSPCHASPRLPAEIVELVIEHAWLTPQSIDDRVSLMTKHVLISKGWLELYLRVSSRHIYIPTPSYLRYLLDFYDGMTAISLMDSGDREHYPAQLCRSLKICMINSPRDDPSERFYVQNLDPSLAHLRVWQTLLRTRPSWIPLNARKRWAKHEEDLANMRLFRLWCYNDPTFLRNYVGLDITPEEAFALHRADDMVFSESFKLAYDERKAIVRVFQLEGIIKPPRSRDWLPEVGAVGWCSSRIKEQL